MKLIQNPKLEELCVYFNNNREDAQDRCRIFIDETINGVKIILGNFDYNILILLFFFIIFFYKAFKKLFNDQKK